MRQSMGAGTELSEQRVGVIVLYALVSLFMVAKVGYYADKVPAGVFPDEIAHASYVVFLSESGGVIPRFEDQRLLNRDGGWGERRNYLGHPPLYYQVIRLLSGVSATGEPTTVDDTVRRLRSVSLPLGIAALSLMLWLGMRLQMPLLCHLVYAVAVVSVPMLSFSVAGINNDVLALATGALTVWGLERWQEGSRTTSSVLLVTCGVGLALLVKLTAAVLCGGLTMTACILWLGRRQNRPQVARLLAAVTAACLPGLVYYGVVLARYGTLVPNLGSRLEWHPPPLAPGSLSLLEWAGRFIHLTGTSFVSITAHRDMDRSWPFEAAGLVVIVLVAATGIIVRRRSARTRLETLRPLIAAALLTFLGVLLIHFAFTYRQHLLTGAYGGAQARYYFVLLPLLLLGASRAFEPVATRFWAVGAALVLCASLLYADFHTFLRDFTTLVS